jgi:hypothetical protein
MIIYIMSDTSVNPFTQLHEYVSSLKTTECSGNSSSDKCSELKTIETKIENTSNDYSDKLTQTRYDTQQNLADKKTSIKIFTKETENLSDHIRNIKQEKQNKRRIVESSEWEYDRYSAHIFIFKIIFVSLFIISLILFTRQKISAIPDTVYFGVIIIIVAIMIFNVGYEVLFNLRRNKFDYDKFDQSYGDRFNTNVGGGNEDNLKSKSGLFKSLICESFVNGSEDNLNGHHYSFIN